MLLSILLLLPACNTKMPEGKKRRSATEPATQAASRPASRPAPRAKAPPQQRFLAVQREYYQYLPKLRKHKWGQPPTSEVLVAARRTFGVETWKDLDGKEHPMGGGIDFDAMTTQHVRQLLGAPSGKKIQGAAAVWTYAYPGGPSLEVTFRDDKVTAYKAVGQGASRSWP
ncbi:MAG TPA: hypothetical protein PKG77_07035 [Phycisphaerae bacterium]|nr:hypothetical protein [Phycisphaerae bacterium]HQL72423.1 hypothetical protein [Phycisphaerae bacterium]